MSSFMSAHFVGLVGRTAIVQRLRAGTQSLQCHFAVAFAQALGSGRFLFRDLFAVHGGKSLFFGLFERDMTGQMNCLEMFR